MKKLSIDAGNKTPSVNFLYEEGLLEIKGKSIPENSVEFYNPIFSWLDEYSTRPQANTKVIIHLEYFNTSSSKCLLDIFRKLERLHTSANSKVNVTWLFEEEDEDMMEAGDDYQSIVKIPFTITKVHE